MSLILNVTFPLLLEPNTEIKASKLQEIQGDEELISVVRNWTTFSPTLYDHSLSKVAIT